MDKKVIWSPRARNDLKSILEYWIIRNKSNAYSVKLSSLFKEATQFISHHPKMGKLTDDKSARFKIVRDYLFFMKNLMIKF